MPTPVVGLGSSLSFGTSGFQAEIDPDSITPPPLDRSVFDTTKLSTAAVATGYLSNATGILGKVVRAGSMVCAAEWDPNISLPIASASETVVLTWPLRSGDATAATWTWTGGLIRATQDGLTPDGKATGTFEVAVLSAIQRTAAT